MAPLLRSSVGLALVSQVTYTYGLAAGATQYVPATLSSPANGSTGATWTFTLQAPRGLGYGLLSVFTDGTLVASAPTVVYNVPPPCSGAYQATADGLCACPAGTALSGPLDPTTCQSNYSIPGIIGGVPSAVILAALLAGAFFYYRLSTSRLARLGDTSWLIKPQDVKTSLPPQILGVGEPWWELPDFLGGCVGPVLLLCLTLSFFPSLLPLSIRLLWPLRARGLSRRRGGSQALACPHPDGGHLHGGLSPHQPNSASDNGPLHWFSPRISW